MTQEEMLGYARSIVDGGPIKKTDVVAFMKALLAQFEQEPSAGGPALTDAEVLTYLPELGFEIGTAETGVHLPREANRWYSRPEALALLAKLTKALKP